MIEILFKAKRMDNGEWVEGLLCKGLFSKFAIEEIQEERRRDVDPETVCQYTGLTDKNGARIYENDIVMLRTGRVCKVTHKANSGYCGFDLEAVEDIENPAPRFAVYMDCEVFGNAHDKEAKA